MLSLAKSVSSPAASRPAERSMGGRGSAVRATAVAGDGWGRKPYNGGGSRLEERPWLPADRPARSALAAICASAVLGSVLCR
jgi:hypothetical protein